MRCIKWERLAESKMALQLLEQWQPIDVIDALELVSPNFTNPTGMLLLKNLHLLDQAQFPIVLQCF